MNPSGSDSTDLRDVEADASDLVEGKKLYEKTCRLGPSLTGKSMIKHYEEKGFFPEGTTRVLGPDEFIPAPQDGEALVFKEYFNAGLRFPCDNCLPLILNFYNVKLHKLTPNAIIQLFKFF